MTALLAAISPAGWGAIITAVLFFGLVWYAAKSNPMGLAVLALLSYPWDARAGDGGPEDAPPPVFSSEGSTFTGTLLSDAGTRTPLFGARIAARWRHDIWGHELQLAGRLDGLAEKAGVDIENPSTYTTVEGMGLISLQIAGPFAAAGVYGLTRPSIGVEGPTRETWLAGALIGTHERWVLVGVGQRRSLGDEPCLMGAWRINAVGKTSVVGDVAARVIGGKLTYVVRAGGAVQLWGRE